MRLSDFDFELPEDLIAQKPAEPRDNARLLHVRPELADYHIPNLPDLLHPGDLLVFNNTQVIPARLQGKRGEAKVEITLHRNAGEYWEAFAKPGRRLKAGDHIVFAAGFTAEVIAKQEEGTVLLSFSDNSNLTANLQRYGQMPLPPYIKRKEKREADFQDYQTIFAQNAGAVAAPTAGLHFTDNLMAALQAKGIAHCTLTLHVGAGTFLPVKTEDISQHKMHYEWIEISPQTAQAITQAKREGRRIVAVGTTSLRSLEAVAAEDGSLQSFQGETNIFITPGYRFKCVDALITNFHLPKSTLFMLVSAFAGLEAMKQAYAHAIAQRYRFFSYGDACLLEKKEC